LPQINSKVLEAQCVSKLGISYLEKREVAEARQYNEQARKLHTALAQTSYDQQVGTAYLNLGSTYIIDKNYDLALLHLNLALSIFQHVFNATHRLIARTFYRLGIAHQYKDNLNDAIANYTKGLECYRTTNIDQPQIAMLLNHIGHAMYKQQKYEEAATKFQNALEISEPLYGKNHIFVADVLHNLGMMKILLHKSDDGLANIQEAVDICELTLGSDHEDTKRIKFDLKFAKNFVEEDKEHAAKQKREQLIKEKELEEKKIASALDKLELNDKEENEKNDVQPKKHKKKKNKKKK